MQNLFSAYGDADGDADESMVVEAKISDDEEFSDYSGTPTESKLTEKPAEKSVEKSDQDEEQNVDEPEVKKPKLERKGIYTSYSTQFFKHFIV